MGNGRRFLLLTACAGLLSTAGRAEEIAVVLREKSRGAYEIRGEFRVTAPRSAAWAVLTDYGRIQEFVSAVQSSRVLERREDGALIEQEMKARPFFFSHRVWVRLSVTEEPPGLLRFEDVAGGDFESYEGRWSVEETTGGVRVLYGLDAKPRFRAPGFLARSAFKRAARDLLEEVRREILRRSEAQASQRTVE